MSEALITSRRNPLLKAVRELHHAVGRLRQQRLLLEGSHLLQEVVRLGLCPDLLLATPQWLERHPELLRELHPSTPCRAVTEEVLEAAATTRHPDGVVLTLPWSLPGDRLATAPPSLGLVLDQVQDPGNLGTLLRTALAAGVEQIWLAEGADPWQPKVLRASSGAGLALPIGRFSTPDLAARLRQARRGGTAVLGTAASGGQPYWLHDWRRPTLVVLGNEGSGISASLREELDGLLSIPIQPGVESLNVAVAAAPLLLERLRQRQGGGAAAAAAGPGGGENATISQPPVR